MVAENSHRGETKTATRKRKWIRATIAIFVVLLLMLFLAPYIISVTGLRDVIVNRVLEPTGLSATTEGASLGWFTPVQIEKLNLEGEQQKIQFAAKEIRADQSWLQILTNRPNLGKITVDSPHLQVKLPLPESNMPVSDIHPTFSAQLTNGSVTVLDEKSNKSLIHVAGVNIAAEISEQTKKGAATRVLRVSPTTIFSKHELTSERAKEFLHWICPSFNQSGSVAGHFSFRIEELEVPIGVANSAMIEQLKFRAILDLHDVELESGNATLQMLAKTIADIHQKPLAKENRVVKNASVSINFQDGCLHYDGLEIGFPDIDPSLVVRSKGTVGLDKHIDLQFEIPRLDKEKQKERGPVVCRVTGTPEKPVVSVTDASLVLHLPQQTEPLLDIDGVDLTMRLEQQDSGAQIVMEPFQALDHQKIDQQLAGTLLRLVDPELSQAAKLAGEVSLEIQSLTLPLDGSDEGLAEKLAVSGKLTIHDASSSSETPIRKMLVKILSDQYGKKPSGEELHLVRDAVVSFQLKQGKFSYEGLEIGFPDIDQALVVRSKGTVGLDETFDLQFEIPRLDKDKQKERGAIVCRVTGTPEEPVVSVTDASLVVHLPQRTEPLLDIDGVDLTMRLEQHDSGAQLVVDPFQALDHQKIDQQLAGTLLRLVDPELSQAAKLAGEVSLDIQSLTLPLNGFDESLAEQLSVSGKLTIHDASSSTETPIRKTLVKILSDQYGKTPSGKELHLVRDAVVSFQLKQGKFSYEGLKIGFPDIDPSLVVRSKGTVGLDETFDLEFEIPRLDKDKQKERGPVLCRVTGTPEEPVVSVKDASLVVHLPQQTEPLLDIDGVDLTMRLEQHDSGVQLVVDPFQALDHQKIDQQLAGTLLRLVDPELSQAAKLAGEVSLDIQSLTLPLNGFDESLAEQLSVSGKLTIHDASSSTETPIRKTLVKILSDQYGKTPSGKELHLVRDAVVSFQLKQGKFSYEGLKIGFPDIDPSLVVRSKGTVGLDETFDLEFEIPRLDKDKQKERGPVLCRVTGTPEEPVVSVKDASLVVHLPQQTEPLLDIDGVDLTMRLEQHDSGVQLVVDPFQALDHQKIDQQLSGTLLRLVDPELSQAAKLAGEVSLEIQSLTLPLDGFDEGLAEQLSVSGKLTIHDASSSSETPIRKTLVKILSDQYGKTPSGKELHLVRDAVISFNLQQGKFSYEGLEIGFPDIDQALVVRSKGTVGLDERFDLQFEIPRLDKDKQKERGPVVCRVTGTPEKPVVSVKDASLVVRIPGQEKPLLDVDSIDFKFQIESDQGVKSLVAQPFVIFE